MLYCDPFSQHKSSFLFVFLVFFPLARAQERHQAKKLLADLDAFDLKQEGAKKVTEFNIGAGKVQELCQVHVLNLPPSVCHLRFMGWLDQQELGLYAGQDKGWTVAGVMTKPLLQKYYPHLETGKTIRGKQFAPETINLITRASSAASQAFLPLEGAKSGESKKNFRKSCTTPRTTSSSAHKRAMEGDFAGRQP